MEEINIWIQNLGHAGKAASYNIEEMGEKYVAESQVLGQ
jgi:hypothetical protein